MNKTCYYFFLWMCFILCSCGDESDNTSTDYGNCPDQLDGKSLVLKNDDGTIKLSFQIWSHNQQRNSRL